MTGPKLNEGSRVAGERTGTRASAKYVGTSAYKAREVLDLVRGLDVKLADEVLQFSERDIAIVIRKVLASAVANAQNNDGMDPDELYLSACFADEGPTAKRFRPRARGRAGHIRKRSCHITVVVDQQTDAMLARRNAKEEARAASGARPRRGATPQASRRERVARSRAAVAPAHDHDHDHDHDHGHDHDHDHAEVDAIETTAVDAGTVDVSTDENDGRIKGNADSMLYHVPGSRYYDATEAEAWFDSVEEAEAAGYRAPGQKSDVASEETE